MKALVAIADRSLQADLAGRLARRGFAVETCSSSSTALELYRRSRPSLVLIGWLEADCDVLALCRRIRSESMGGLPILWTVTDRDGARDDRELIEAGVDECLLLPAERNWSEMRLAAVRRRIEELASLQTAEEALRLSNERLDLATVAADEGLWDAHAVPGQQWSSPDGPVWFSPRMKSLLGFADEELPNRFSSWSDRLHPDDRDRVLQALGDHIEHRKPYDVEYRLLTKQGEYRWYGARGQGSWNESGQLVRISGVLRDITQSRNTADALRASERKWRGLVEHAPDIISVTDLDGTIRSLNRTLPGKTVDQVVDTSIFDYISPEYQPLVRETMGQVARTGEPSQVELAVDNPDGSTSWLSSRVGPIRDDKGVESLVSITTNITSRKLVEEERAKFFALVENSGDFIGMLTTCGKVMYLNPAGCQLVGLADLAQAKSLPMADYYWEGSREKFLETVLPAALSAGRWAGEMRFRHRVGDRPIDVHQKLFVVHRPSDGEPMGLATITRDITDRKIYEANLKHEQESLRRLLDLQERERQLVAYEIHDGLVQEMTAALMHLEASQHNPTADQREANLTRGQKLLREAVNEARRLISGLRPPVLDELGIVAAVEYLINEAREQVADIKYVHHVRFAHLVPPLESAIFRIVQEALTNIRKHSGSARASVELLEQGDRLRLVVRDWGRGFDPASVGKDRFGLQGIHQRARLLGTVAVVESAPGKGTVIVLDLPIVHAEPDGPTGTERERRS